MDGGEPRRAAAMKTAEEILESLIEDVEILLLALNQIANNANMHWQQIQDGDMTSMTDVAECFDCLAKQAITALKAVSPDQTPSTQGE